VDEGREVAWSSQDDMALYGVVVSRVKRERKVHVATFGRKERRPVAVVELGHGERREKMG
jgi:hypothetical protein